MKKITKATFKSFIRKNAGNLKIRVKTAFDGMTDCCEPRSNVWMKAEENADHSEHSLGVQGVWLVNGSRDYFKPFEGEGHQGIEVSNCCGHFIIAIES